MTQLANAGQTVGLGSRPDVPRLASNLDEVLFVIHAIDRPDALDLRKATRPAHLEFLADFATPVGGPLLDADGQMCGSCIVLDVPDRAAADAFVANDPYARAGLFESVSVHEFMKVSWPQ